MTTNKTRHEPEHRIIDPAVFRDPDDGHSVVGRSDRHVGVPSSSPSETVANKSSSFINFGRREILLIIMPSRDQHPPILQQRSAVPYTLTFEVSGKSGCACNRIEKLG